ncbi:leucine-rich repeat protein [[Eubacterium] siraeum]|uniref:Leucine-rich repeat protein n=1 Tax=[Eubacterium] siraeum TaxID=39492 RepID=A0AAW6D7R0_9FIRM|nr:leucine-rich repeat protein [[Eubacterium] siraeum]MDB8004923.1 leucine-rich repeat protein [[Eubacterium] siraeum]
MKLKRFAVGFIAAVMAFAVLGTPLGDILPFVRESVATTEGAESYGDYTYRLRTDSELTGTIEITGYSGNNSELKIIDNINGNPVTRLADNAFKNCKNLTKVVVPDSVVNMGDYVFYGCVNLDEINIPDDMNYIGKYSFDNTKILNNQSETLKYIGNWVIDCKNVEDVSIKNGTRGIAGRAFEYCTKLKNIIIPEGVVRISVDAFYYCSNLTSITLPDSLKYISWYAFGWCTNLESITIPSGVTWVGDDAFAYCRKLKSISIPQGVSQISHWIFYDCTNLESITIYDGIEFIGIYAFYDCTKLKEIAIPSSVKSIQKYAFAYCRSLQNVVLPRSVTSLGEKAFLNCSSLETITIPDSVTEISSSAFDGCSSKLTIKGAKGSLAEKFAKQQGFKFEVVKFTHGRADEKLNSVYITWSDVEINELQYPIYNEDEFAKQLKYWVEVDKKEYFVSLQPFLEKYTYKDILSLHVNIPVMTENGEAYSVKGESTVADLMAYILFADSVQDYIEQTLNEVRNRISNSKPYYAFFLDKIKNFNSQYLYFQQRLEGKDAFNDTLQSLLLAKTAMSIIDGLKVTYKSGETKYITFGNSGQTAEDFIKIYKEDIVSTVPLKTYSYFTDLYKATVSESPKYYDELKYYILSGGDTSYLNSYYKDTLKGYSLQIKNVKELFKIAKDTGSLPSETGSLIGLGLDNLSYWADKYNTEHSSEIKLAKEVWSWSNKAKDIIGAVSKGSLVGAFSSAYDITQSYIDEVKKVYQNASNTEAGWYAITYCYLQDNNPKLLEAIIDSETGNAEISIDRLIRYGFPVHSDDIIEKDIAKYYEKHSSLNYTFTPDEEFRFYLWNACNNINTIKNIDCNEYREMLFQYILAELNLESGTTGVQYVADITANDSTLGSVSGTGVYSTKETITLSAVPYENVSFSGWKNILTGEIESKERNYSINLNDNIKYEAQFAPAEVDTAEQPVILQQPLSRNYRLGDTPVSLTITASNNDSGSLSVKWYKNSSDKNYGGIYISEGFSIIPNLSEVGTYYYYAIVTNTLCSKVGLKTVTTQSSKCTDTAKIVISEPVLSGIEIDSLPNKTEYDKYEYFDNTGMTVKLVYSNGNKVIFNDYCISGFDNSLVGDNVITISAYGYSAKLTLHIKEHIHNYNLWRTTVNPTCTEGGEMIRSCSVCGVEETKTIDALGHDYSEQWTIDEEADCVNDGSKSHHCTRCKAKKDITSIPATGHKYVETVVEPSYSNRGYTLYECSVCGYSYKDNYEEQLIVPAVTGFASGSQTKSSAVLGWDKVSDADGYAVELYTGGKWNEVFRTSDSSVTSCTVGSLKADSTYSLRIRAFKDTDDGTVYSDYTRLAVKTKLANVAGLKAQGVTATAVKLDWARNAGATGYIIEQYKGGKWTQIAVTKNNYTLTFTVKGLAECTPYSFRVKAYKNDGGKTNYSDYVTVKASTLLGTVKNAKVTSTTGTWITLGWDRNTGAAGYVLEQYKGGRWTEIAVTKNNTTLKFTVKGLRNDTTYSFRIKAYKTVGDTTTYGSYVRVVGTTDIPNVAKFTGSAVSASAVKLDWSKNDKATGYVIEQYKGGRWTEIKAVDNDITEITVEGLAKGTAYTFRIKSVKTVDGADKSSEYASVKVKTAE